jgi:Fe-S-cluster containining protein
MGCLRTGFCCENVPLQLSPKQLRESYDGWFKNAEGVKVFKEIFLIFPMLRPKGVYEGPGPSGVQTKAYLYRCVHFSRDKSGRGRCEIYDHRPMMCKGYPDYPGLSEDVRADAPKPVSAGAWYKGCGFRPDGTGVDPKSMVSCLKPIPPEEL